MPFVQRAVGPVRLSRAKLHDERGAPTVRDGELEAVTNCALSNALRQMASVATLADEVFRELRGQLADVAARSAGLKLRVQAVGRLVDASDPRAVTVRKSSFFSFFCRYPGFDSPVSVPSYSHLTRSVQKRTGGRLIPNGPGGFIFVVRVFIARNFRRPGRIDETYSGRESPIVPILLQPTAGIPASARKVTLSFTSLFIIPSYDGSHPLSSALFLCKTPRSQVYCGV